MFRTLRFVHSWMIVSLLLSLTASQGQEKAPKLPLYPIDVAVADNGIVYVADRNLPGVWKWEEGKLSILFQGSTKYRTPLNAPRCIAIGKDGQVLVGDTSTRDVYRVSQDEAVPVTGGKIGIPMDLAVAGDGSIYVADLELRKLFLIPADSKEVEEVAAINPRGVGLSADGKIWVVSQNKEQLQTIGEGNKPEIIVPERVFQFPHQVVVDENEVAYVTDGYANAVWKVVAGSPPTKLVAGEPLQKPVGLCYADGQLYVVDPGARKVFRISLEGKVEALFELVR